MQSVLELESSALQEKGALHTAREIAQQPYIWEKIREDLGDTCEVLREFLNKAYEVVDNIILTGAGTSAYIGLSLTGSFFRHTNILSRAIPTTDLVAHPHDYFHANRIPLIISFARSGNSPESCAALDLADNISTRCYHLIITCNGAGELANRKSKHPQHLILLPPECNDKSLAMTSSYTGMLLTGALITRLHNPEHMQQQVNLLSTYGKRLLSNYTPLLRDIARKRFTRAVFLGDGAFYGTATEAHLKLQELSGGKVICKSDSFLGFRHGPKAVIDENTLVVYIFSDTNYVLNYEKDLVVSMKQGNKALMEIGILPSGAILPDLDATIITGNDHPSLEEDLLCVCSILPLQLLAFYTSLALGLQPDNPSANGAITRVVEGVAIYPLNA
jgi:tagatose-6-phosphate ketose/aldose isomerase